MPLLSDSPPDAANLAYVRGVEAQITGDLGLAKQEWRRALTLQPAHISALYNLAVALALTKEAGAEDLYEKILVLEPAHQNALYNLANLNKQKGATGEAQSLYRRLIEAHPNFAAAYINLAKCYSDDAKWDEAEELLRKALEIEPTHAFAHWNLSHILLRVQRWAEGWRDYEYRLQLPGWLQSPVNVSAWHGEAAAKRILLWNDQGIGDAIQFLRYAKIVADRGHEVWVLVQENLKTIAATVPGVRHALAPTDELPPFDAQAPLLSLPHRLGMAEPLGGVKNYMRASHTMPLPRRTNHRAVGLVWAGNQNFINNANRSVALDDLMPLFDMPDIDWFSLQFGAASAQIRENKLSERIHDLSPHLHDFSDTAAAIAALDLVISIDTSVAHLAGAMGKPCWLMLPAIPDWRWAGQGESTPWYPSMRVFRQEIQGDWHGIARHIAKFLTV